MVTAVLAAAGADLAEAEAGVGMGAADGPRAAGNTRVKTAQSEYVWGFERGTTVALVDPTWNRTLWGCGTVHVAAAVVVEVLQRGVDLERFVDRVYGVMSHRRDDARGVVIADAVRFREKP